MRREFKGLGIIVVFLVTLIGSLLYIYLFPKGLLAIVYNSISSDSVAFAALTIFSFLISLLYAQYTFNKNMTSFRRSSSRKFNKISKRRGFIDRRKIKVPWSGKDRRTGIERRVALGYA